MIQLMDDFYLQSKVIGCPFAFSCVHRAHPFPQGRLYTTLVYFLASVEADQPPDITCGIGPVANCFATLLRPASGCPH